MKLKFGICQDVQIWPFSQTTTYPLNILLNSIHQSTENTRTFHIPSGSLSSKFENVKIDTANKWHFPLPVHKHTPDES